MAAKGGEREQIQKFQKFIIKKPFGFCCVCMKVLYPVERKYRHIKNINCLSCIERKLQLMVKPGSSDIYMVCSKHLKTDENDSPRFVYSGLYLSYFYVIILLQISYY
jgi:hypothetical protein